MSESDQASKKPNRLIDEQSPYLLQHAYNPVAWMPWGEEAFTQARDENKPIFLSIGYSTCHWCHVMEHESFEDEAVADFLQEHFVSIKLDREERPDIDRIYMSFVQATSGQGGWPLNVWLTPDLEPFAGGTYFPPREAHGRPSFLTVLQSIARAWENEREGIIKHGAEVVHSLRAAEGAVEASDTLNPDWVSQGYQYFARQFDSKDGGFGHAPKFPRPSTFQFLLHYGAGQSAAERSEHVREMAQLMVTKTLDEMAAGGMYDHLGGGFHRYSVDAEWHVPHFEKMLYDQAQLIRVYLEAFQITKKEKYAQVAQETIDYVLRDLRHEKGAFFSAEDADSLARTDSSKKLEGAFYVWHWDEVKDLLTEEEFTEVAAAFHLEEGGNVNPASDPHGELREQNVLTHRGKKGNKGKKSDPSTALEEACKKLFQHRANRPRPHLDDKIIVAWNSLMISSLAYAYQVLPEDRTLTAAVEATEFILTHLAKPEEGLLQRSYRKSSSGIAGFAEDYAYFIQALIDLYEAGGEIRYLQLAASFQKAMDEKFWDVQSGGYFSSQGGEDVIMKMKEGDDGAEPSSNSVAALNLCRLADLMQSSEMMTRADELMKHFGSTLDRFPAALPLMLTAVLRKQEPPTQVVMAGTPDSPPYQDLMKTFFQSYRPEAVILHADGDGGQDWLIDQGAPIKGFAPADGMPALYLCQDYQCQLPVTDPQELVKLLKK
ncbi:MAG: thioredoxin domain-containing protein [Verrucomicrobiota bacterium]